MRAASMLCLLLVLATAGCADTGGPGGSAPSEGGTPSSQAGDLGAAHAFLDTYVADDGRVLRLDQGSDVVSESQAYGMLVAELAGRDDLVPVIWDWTRQHLQRPDGLLSWHASGDGTVVGTEAAADADVLAAYALLRYEGEGEEELHADGRALAQAVLEQEVVEVAGSPVLAAGPWAVASGTVNPSYWMPAVFDRLAETTGDRTWSGLAESSVALVRAATHDGQLLPPDWARLEGARLVPVADASGTDGQPVYGPDAQRVPLWFASACQPEARSLAGRWWDLLQVDDRSSSASLTPAGDVTDPAASPVALLAAAAAARAAGDDAAVADLENGAQDVATGSPTYYGDAWLALAAGLREQQLTSC